MDGTLLATDVMWEAILIAVRTKPALLFRLPFWLLWGRAFVKQQLARHVALNPALLPYNERVVSLVADARRGGRYVILATAADRVVAESVARRFALFSAVLASDGKRNLSGREKLAAIVDHLKGAEFDYIGNSHADLPIWRAATRAILVRPSRRLLARARRVSTAVPLSWARRTPLSILARVLRIHQWSKNALVFVPLLLAHEFADASRLLHGFLAFVAFGLAASAIYIINDLFDLDADRQHPHKRSRPIAAGEISISTALAIVPVAIGAGLIIGMVYLPQAFTGMLLLYVGAAIAYSFLLKCLSVIDVLLLAGVYTLRVLAGATATDVPASPWFLAFALFFFLSLAFVKRYSELKFSLDTNTGTRDHVARRPYVAGDLDLLRSIGTTSGYVAVAVLALYLNTPDVHLLYRKPMLLWLVGVALLYWVTRAWLLAHRGQMHTDPVLFALTDRVSYAVAGFVVVVMALAVL
jgi:4-hydroxybenzoate polyprenyltransferase/phosphoserine phosphatase